VQASQNPTVPVSLPPELDTTALRGGLLLAREGQKWEDAIIPWYKKMLRAVTHLFPVYLSTWIYTKAQEAKKKDPRVRSALGKFLLWTGLDSLAASTIDAYGSDITIPSATPSPVSPESPDMPLPSSAELPRTPPAVPAATDNRPSAGGGAAPAVPEGAAPVPEVKPYAFNRQYELLVGDRPYRLQVRFMNKLLDPPREEDWDLTPYITGVQETDEAVTLALHADPEKADEAGRRIATMLQSPRLTLAGISFGSMIAPLLRGEIRIPRSALDAIARKAAGGGSEKVVLTEDDLKSLTFHNSELSQLLTAMNAVLPANKQITGVADPFVMPKGSQLSFSLVAASH
ncbi:MAG: hypothetical protein WCX61_03075, partial [Candidatus Peribacteraceae bacterium]